MRQGQSACSSLVPLRCISTRTAASTELAMDLLRTYGFVCCSLRAQRCDGPSVRRAHPVLLHRPARRRRFSGLRVTCASISSLRCDCTVVIDCGYRLDQAVLACSDHVGGVQ